MRDQLGLSYSNIRGLHKFVDDIPAQVPWTTKTLAFGDTPDERHLIQYCDPIEAIRALLGDPAHAADIVYAPSKVFTNVQRESRIYNEMWTGKWWHVVQVIMLVT